MLSPPSVPAQIAQRTCSTSVGSLMAWEGHTVVCATINVALMATVSLMSANRDHHRRFPTRTRFSVRPTTLPWTRAVHPFPQSTQLYTLPSLQRCAILSPVPPSLIMLAQCVRHMCTRAPVSVRGLIEILPHPNSHSTRRRKLAA